MSDVKLSPDAGPVAREVFRRMSEQGVGQKALAVKAGLNETYVRDLLAGKSKNPKAAQLRKLADALGCDIRDLTEPGRAGQSDPPGEIVNDPDELALLRFWRSLSDIGRMRILSRADDAVPPHPLSRKVDNLR